MRPIRLIALAALASVALAACGGNPDAPRISDPAFAERAERLCAQKLPSLRADVSDDEPREPTEVAPTVEDRADSLESLVAALTEVPVSDPDRRAVEGWLDDWADYVAVGRRYAEALRDGDPQRYSAVAEEGVGPQTRISAFARVNGFESCALDGVPLPERESPI